MIERDSPDTGVSVFTYDEAGNLTAATDARGVDADRAYDALSRLLTVSYPGSPSEDVTYSYDAAAGGNYGIGRLTGIADASGTTAVTYDHRGNVVREVRTINKSGGGATAYTTDYAYDLADTWTRAIGATTRPNRLGPFSPARSVESTAGSRRSCAGD